jgi:multiple sugar transport system ATP-binding protein
LAGADSTGRPSAQRLGLRPEHLQLRPVGEGVPAQVVLAEHLGDVSIVHLRVDGLGELLSAKLGAQQAQVVTGQTVGLLPDTAWVLGFDSQGRRVD